ncbi:MAG: hypothetical protein WBL44_07845 [Nitrososphaeraceae archaeon]|jgi:hypothetical protein
MDERPSEVIVGGNDAFNPSLVVCLKDDMPRGELSIVIEEKENENKSDLGLATYSNSESTVLSYASIFENLWAQSN